MTPLAWLLGVKIALTVFLWCVPLLLAAGPAARALGSP